MRCEEIMKIEPEFISPNETVQAAAKKMEEGNLGFLPVCDESKKILGAITDRDLAIRVLAQARPADTQVSEVMTQEVISCRPEDDLQKAEQLMGKNQKSRIMCVDSKKHLVGVISLSDVAQRDRRHASQTLSQISERETHA